MSVVDEIDVSKIDTNEIEKILKDLNGGELYLKGKLLESDNIGKINREIDKYIRELNRGNDLVFINVDKKVLFVVRKDYKKYQLIYLIYSKDKEMDINKTMIRQIILLLIAFVGNLYIHNKQKAK